MAIAVDTPQGLRSHVFGAALPTSTGAANPVGTGSADTFTGVLTASTQPTNLLQNLGPNAIAIAGRQYIVNTEPDYRREMFKHKTIPSQRQSINLTNVSGQGTINTEGLWRREQTDWTMGAGQKYLDRNQQSAENRFYRSKGIDAFGSPNQLTLLNTTKQFRESSSTNLAMAQCGTYLYVIDDGHVYESANDWATSSPTWSTMTFHSATGHPTPTAFYSIDSNGTFVYVASNTGIWYYKAGGAGGTVHQFECYAENPSTGHTYNLVRWVNNKVLAAAGPSLYCFPISTASAVHTTWPNAGNAPTNIDLLMSQFDSSWVWTDACSGAANVYACGYWQIGTNGTGTKGTVYKIGISVNNSGTSVGSVVWNYPVETLPLSPDEYPVSLQNYLNYLFLGTNKGIRMCQTLSVYDPNSNGSGDLKSGPLIPNQLQSVTHPVRAITGDGRFVWFGWSNYDSVSTGLGKLDLSMYIEGEPLTPSYQSDLMVDHQGEVLDAMYDPINGVVLLAVSGHGFYRGTISGDVPHYVSHGTLETGGFSYGIPDHKIPVFFDYGVDMPDNTPIGATEGYVYADLEIEPFDASQKSTLAIPQATEGQSEQKILQGSAYNVELFQTLLHIYSDSTGVSTPTVYRWTLKSWPSAVSETEITVPLLMRIVNVVDGLETYADPYEQFMFLEDLRKNQTIVQYQESTLTANVVVDTLEWVPHKRQGNYEGGFEGDLVVTLKTIGGYNQYTGFITS